MRYFFEKNKDKERKEQKDIRRLILSCFILVLICAILMCIPTAADARIYDNVIRFHVIANSDTDDDQSLKLEVRDSIIEKYSYYLSGYSSKEEAQAALESKKNEIKMYAESVVKKLGYDYECDVELGIEHYGRTVYESFSMPQGNYTSLRIIIGEGAGHNWWCVLFPPLCTKAALSSTEIADEKEEFTDVGFTGEQYNIITKTDKPKYKIKFRLLELFFGG